MHDHFAFNPYFFNKMSINPFQLAERNYPVDMGMPYDEKYILNMHLPNQYGIENNLQNQSVTLADNDGIYTTHFENGANGITFSSLIKFNRAVYPTGEYPYLKQFFNKIIAAEKANLIIQKK